MALYEQFDADGNKVARAFTVDGSERDAEMKALVGTEGWELADEGAKPKSTAARKDS